MSDRILLYLIGDAASRVEIWRATETQAPERLASGEWNAPEVRAALERLGDQAAGVWVVMPGSWASLLSVPLPTRRRDQARRAMRFAAEERVADDIDSVHLTLGQSPEEREKDFAWPLMVVSRERRDSLLQALEKLGLHVEALVSPLDLWPTPPAGEWHVHRLPETPDLVVRTGSHGGFLLPVSEGPGDVAEALGRLVETDLDGPEKLVLFGTVGGHVPNEAERFERRGELAWPASWVDALTTGNEGELPLSAVPSRSEYEAPRRRRQWAWVAVLALAVGASLVLQRGVSGYLAASDVAALDERIRADFHAALPDVERMVDPRVQIEQALKSRSPETGDDNFLRLFERLVTALEQTRKEGEKLWLGRVEYEDGDIEVRLVASRPEAFQAYRGYLAQGRSELSVGQGGAEETGNGNVATVVTIEEPDSRDAQRGQGSAG